MRLDLLSQSEEKRAKRLDARVTRLNYLLDRDADNTLRCNLLKKELRRRELELELLDLRSEELAEGGAEPIPRDSDAGVALTDANA